MGFDTIKINLVCNYYCNFLVNFINVNLNWEKAPDKTYLSFGLIPGPFYKIYGRWLICFNARSLIVMLYFATLGSILNSQLS